MEMKRYDPRGAAFLRMGRYEKAETECRLWWEGSGLRTVATCATLELEAEAPLSEHMPWLGVAIDGAPVARLAMGAGARRYVLLSGMDATVSHEISITRDSEPTQGEAAPVRLVAVYADGELRRPEPRKRLVEFIGDSLTVGEGCLGPVSAAEWRMAWASNLPAFSNLAAELLGAEKRVLALGGWGVWRSWDGNENNRIGRIYERLCPQIAGGDGAYDFDQPHADAVVINLGTNDGSALGKLPEADQPAAREEICRRAEELMAMVREHEPEAVILWAYGFCGDGLTDIFQKAVEARRAAGDARTGYLALSGFGGDFGAIQHPGRLAHARAAREIADALRAWWKD